MSINLFNSFSIFPVFKNKNARTPWCDAIDVSEFSKHILLATNLKRRLLELDSADLLSHQKKLLSGGGGADIGCSAAFRLLPNGGCSRVRHWDSRTTGFSTIKNINSCDEIPLTFYSLFFVFDHVDHESEIDFSIWCTSAPDRLRCPFYIIHLPIVNEM